MKNICILVLSVLIISCKQASNNSENNTQTETSTTHLKKYPENIMKVFDAHGGLDAWHSMNSLEFTMSKETGDEVTSVSLKSRKSLIQMPSHNLGYDGKNVWLQKKDTLSYKGNAKFYYNLMFYFYGMPFVLADEGIVYENVEPLIVDDQSYPGIKISFNDGIGESPEDEYILYYNAVTHKMAWLAYTMTYFSKTKSKKFNYIRYKNWQEVNGVLLPEIIQWMTLKDGVVENMRNEVVFNDIELSKQEMPESLFSKPENAELVE